MIRGLYMIELEVSDWAGAVRWYGAVLGASVVLRDEPNQFALVQIGTSRIALKAGTPSAGDAVLTFLVDDLKSELSRLAGADVLPLEPATVSPEGYVQASLTDPDGHRIRLFEWTTRPS